MVVMNYGVIKSGFSAFPLFSSLVNILYFIADLIDFCHFFSLSLSLLSRENANEAIKIERGLICWAKVEVLLLENPSRFGLFAPARVKDLRQGKPVKCLCQSCFGSRSDSTNRQAQ